MFASIKIIYIFASNKTKKEMLVTKEVKEQVEASKYINDQITLYKELPHMVEILMGLEKDLEELSIEGFRNYIVDAHAELKSMLADIAGTIDAEVYFVLDKVGRGLKILPSKQRTVNEIIGVCQD